MRNWSGLAAFRQSLPLFLPPGISGKALAAKEARLPPLRAMRRRWHRQGKQGFAWVSFLRTGARWDAAEFHLTGVRFVERMAERFVEYGHVPPSHANLLEIGCGVGRFLAPLACRFKNVTGVDFAPSMLKQAARYCGALPNVRLIQNNGASLGAIADGAMDYVVSAGVFQHVTDFEVIAGYLREGLRVLRPGGVFLFQFEANRVHREGRGNVGAQITARRLDRVLCGQPFRICEISYEERDPIRNLVIVLEKRAQPNTDPGFGRHERRQRPWLLGVYDDVATATSMHDRLAGSPEPFTFDD